MQAYRRGHPVESRGGRLSQEGVLRLMGLVDPKYSDRYDHSTVARWESGATRPTIERLVVFGRALDLSTTEIEGMIQLAGLGENGEMPSQPVPGVGEGFAQVENEGISPDVESKVAEVISATFASKAVRYSLTRFILPGLGVAIAGYILSAMGWNASWMMMMYLMVVISLVLAQGYLRMRRTNELKDLYFISVFFVLCTNLLQVPILRMDPFGFYAIDGLAGTPIPYLLGLVSNLLLALVAGLMFDALMRWQNGSSRRIKCPFGRASLVAFTPLSLVYVFTLLCWSVGSWIYFLSVFSFLGAMFVVFLALQDDEVQFSQFQRRLLLQASVATTLIYLLLDGAAILVVYWQPSLLVLPDHTLLRSWEIDFNSLGYSPDELIERYRIGAVWSSIAGLIFMVIALGGRLIVSAYRLENGDPPYDTKGTENVPDTTEVE